MNTMNRRRFAALAAAGLGVALLGGCAGSMFRPLKPEVSVADIHLEGGTLLEQRFLLTLRVTNPNSFDIPVEGLSFTLDVNGQPFARGIGNKPVVIPKLGEALVEVKATTGLGSLLRQFRGAAKGGLGKVEYRLKGRLVTGGSYGDLDFDHKGEIGMPALSGEAGGGAKPPSEKF